MIFHQAFTLNQFRENTYIIWDSQGIGIIVDPGCYTFEERQSLKSFIEEKNVTTKTKVFKSISELIVNL